jgi:hypothetical protein
LGTLLFNANTFDAMLPGLGWLQQDLAVWIPDFVGSILFLASGYLAFGETCHTYWAWKPQSLSWWITFTNLFGCVAFMISAFFAFETNVSRKSPRRDWRLEANLNRKANGLALEGPFCGTLRTFVELTHREDNPSPPIRVLTTSFASAALAAP